jgi:hypothetical protein
MSRYARRRYRRRRLADGACIFVCTFAGGVLWNIAGAGESASSPRPWAQAAVIASLLAVLGAYWMNRRLPSGRWSR